MKVILSNWNFTERQALPALITELSRLSGMKLAVPRNMTILKESLDMRGGRSRHVYTLCVELPESLDLESLRIKNPKLRFQLVEEEVQLPGSWKPPAHFSQRRAVVVGSGPAGSFAALSLARAGISVDIVERGAPVGRRLPAVRSLFSEGVLCDENNICFGEGGAGTFSDGKLTTRKNHPWIRYVFETLVFCSAPEEILTSGKPHIGSDRLRAVVVELRKHLESLGVRFHFDTRIDELEIADGRVRSLGQRGKIRFENPDAIVWATGHSARDSYDLLARHHVAMQAKPFAVGLRIEHPQALVNRWQNHCEEEHGPATYSLVHNIDERRSVYSFCMCPGGQVVCSSSHAGFHVVNGMSNYARNEKFANAGLVVKVDPGDFEHPENPLAGMHFQQTLEAAAFEQAGRSYLAPAQRVDDFMAMRPTTSLSSGTSYRPGLVPADLSRVLPVPLRDALCISLQKFEKRFPGFTGPEALLIGIESRTSAPVRIARDTSGTSPTLANLYPCGEGAGYAGGIVSAALDGLHIAEKMVLNWGFTK